MLYDNDSYAVYDAVEVGSEVLPSRVLNPVLYVLLPRIGVVELGGIVLFVAAPAAWSATEFYWSPYRLRVGITTGEDTP